jgi:hypothetical protein
MSQDVIDKAEEMLACRAWDADKAYEICIQPRIAAWNEELNGDQQGARGQTINVRILMQKIPIPELVDCHPLDDEKSALTVKCTAGVVEHYFRLLVDSCTMKEKLEDAGWDTRAVVAKYYRDWCAVNNQEPESLEEETDDGWSATDNFGQKDDYEGVAQNLVLLFDLTRLEAPGVLTGRKSFIHVDIMDSLK